MVDRSLAIFLGIIVLVLYLVVAIYLKVKPKMIAISCVLCVYCIPYGSSCNNFISNHI